MLNNNVDREGGMVADGGQDGDGGEVLLEEVGHQLDLPDVGCPRLLPDVVGRVVAGHEDVVDVGVEPRGGGDDGLQGPGRKVAAVLAPVAGPGRVRTCHLVVNYNCCEVQ